jgi:hypothetical protein
MQRDSIKRAVRTFIITTLALFVPGLLGFLHQITEWAVGQGERPFPDAHGLWFLAVSALVAGVVAVINFVWNLVEDGIGKGLLRPIPASPRENDA